MDLLIIPDGNRRWAKERNKGYDFGYSQLPIIIAMVIDTLREAGISRLFFWCNSTDNLSRPTEQVNSFLSHYADILKYVTEPEKLSIHIKGNRKLFPDRTRKNRGGGVATYTIL
ncbi:MAG: undecaprenyl diphosphate synthase family protein [Thermodesulfobacteriota bacterium]